MAGGTWLTQNKVRPGAYINVVGVPKPLSSVSDRGIVAVPMDLSWGDQVIELNVQELLSGDSQYKAGVLYSDSDALAFRLLFQGAAKAIIYRTNYTVATAASVTVTDVGTVTAKGKGTFGNRIAVKFEKVTSGGSTTYIFRTYIDGTLRVTQKGTSLEGLEGNDWVSFEPAEEPELAADTAITSLTGGSNGETPATALSSALAEFQQRTWNTLAAPVSSSTEKQQVTAYIKSLREDEGVKVQAVLSEYDADYEGIINCCQSFRLSNSTVVTKALEVYLVAGLTAGASLVESNSGKVIQDAIEVIDAPKTNDEIVEGLEGGKFILSRRADGAIIVESDINSLHTLTPSKGYVFTKNRPLRVLDNIANDIKALFIQSYLGKVSNNKNGRSIFKGDLISYFNNLQQIEAIQNFDAESDVTISPGEAIDAVVVECWIQPVDSMEKLYMKVNVEG